MFNDMNFIFNEMEILKVTAVKTPKIILEPGNLKTTFIPIVQILDTYRT